MRPSVIDGAIILTVFQYKLNTLMKKTKAKKLSLEIFLIAFLCQAKEKEAKRSKSSSLKGCFQEEAMEDEGVGEQPAGEQTSTLEESEEAQPGPSDTIDAPSECFRVERVYDSKVRDTTLGVMVA